MQRIRRHEKKGGSVPGIWWSRRRNSDTHSPARGRIQSLRDDCTTTPWLRTPNIVIAGISRDFWRNYAFAVYRQSSTVALHEFQFVREIVISLRRSVATLTIKLNHWIILPRVPAKQVPYRLRLTLARSNYRRTARLKRGITNASHKPKMHFMESRNRASQAYRYRYAMDTGGVYALSSKKTPRRA